MERCVGYKSGQAGRHPVYGRCNREAHEEVNGRWLCKQHAAGRKRSITVTQKKNDKYDADVLKQEEYIERASKISIDLGITVHAFYNVHTSSWIPQALVHFDDLEDLALLVNSLLELKKSYGGKIAPAPSA